MKRLLLFLISISWVGSSFAQTCAQNLRLAQATYEQGRLHEVPQYLNGCLQSGSIQEKVTAYKLLCLTYIYLEEPQKADDAMLNLLRTDNYFQINPAADAAEFVALYRTFRTDPIYRIGASLGVNATQPNVISTLKTITSAKSEYKYKIGIQFGASADLPVTDRFTMNAGLNYQQRKFELISENEQGDGDINVLTVEESQNWINLPIIAQYNVIKSKYNPYVGLGISADLLLNDDITARRDRGNETPIDDKSFDVKQERNKVNISGIFTVGSKTRLGGGYIVAEIKYIYGVTKVNDERSAYDSQELFLTYGMPNSIFRLNAVSCTLGYVYNMFNPKKINR